MNLKKTIANLANNHTVLFTIVAAVALMYVMKNYSNGKGLGGTAGYANSNTQRGNAPLPGTAFGDAGASGYVLNARNLLNQVAQAVHQRELVDKEPVIVLQLV